MASASKAASASPSGVNQNKPKMTASYLRWQLEKKSVHRAFDFDVYYPLLKSHTWASRIITFSPALAQACVNYYQARFNRRTSDLRPEDVKLLRDLEGSLDNAMTTSSSTRFFVRMSNRSPKDGFPLDPSALSRQFQSELSKFQTPASATASTAAAAAAAPTAPPAPPTDTSTSADEGEEYEDALFARYSANQLMVAYSGIPRMRHL